MLIVRLGAWLVEKACEALLLTTLVIVLGGGFSASGTSVSNEIAFTAAAVVVVFMVGSGYLLTTAILGLFLRGPIPWVYSTITSALFILHEQFLFTGWRFPNVTHLQTEVAGACIVFGCTFAEGKILRKISLWDEKRSGLSYPPTGDKNRSE